MATRRLLVSILLAGVLLGCGDDAPEPSTGRSPNVLWIIADDMSFEVGAFGDAVARTPNLDRLAREGVRYPNAFATSGVCAPSRATLLTGMYATSIGAHHMRSLAGGYQPVPPPNIRTFTEPLRAAGYYASSLGKLDYQFSDVFGGAPLTNWDETNRDWRGAAPGQPFFTQVSLFETHESRLFGSATPTTDPDTVAVPPYYPDTPLVRRDIARHYDNVASLDAQVGRLLDRLDADGLADDTIVFFFPDNGRGLPRDKRWVYDGGIHAPLIVRWPGHLAAGSVDERLVSFVDFAPTVLALAGLTVPPHMPGRVFLGPHAAPPPAFVFAAEDRNDEAPDRVRAVRDARYKYIRNYHPDTPYGQTIAFRDQLGTMQEIYRLHDAGALAPPADWYFRATKPVEELYDTVGDPFELDNLAERPEQRARLARMRAAHLRWVTESGDLGAVPEAELAERYWPGGVQPVTPPPRITLTDTAAGGVRVRIRSEVDGASIAYTLADDSRPHWQLYSAPLVLDAPAVVRARAVRYGWAASPEASADVVIHPRAARRPHASPGDTMTRRAAQ
ncbi:MAG: sulfatase-like hydrolase/transferase [Deltaproteobacteria bacterium]|nr:sulfatase-like hydrolase/transferase [Deltaproteobacteria bacterium]